MSTTKDCYWDRDLATLVCVHRLKALVVFLEVESRYNTLSPLLLSGLTDARTALDQLAAAEAKVSIQIDADLESAKKWLSAHSTTELAVIEGGSHDPRSA